MSGRRSALRRPCGKLLAGLDRARHFAIRSTMARTADTSARSGSRRPRGIRPAHLGGVLRCSSRGNRRSRNCLHGVDEGKMASRRAPSDGSASQATHLPAMASSISRVSATQSASSSSMSRRAPSVSGPAYAEDGSNRWAYGPRGSLPRRVELCDTGASAGESRWPRQHANLNYECSDAEWQRGWTSPPATHLRPPRLGESIYNHIACGAGRRALSSSSLGLMYTR